MMPLIYLKTPVIPYDRAIDLEGRVFFKDNMQKVSHLYSHFDPRSISIWRTLFDFESLEQNNVALGPNRLQEKEERREGF